MCSAKPAPCAQRSGNARWIGRLCGVRTRACRVPTHGDTSFPEKSRIPAQLLSVPYRAVRWSTLIALTLALIACNTDPRVASRKYLRSGDAYFSQGKFKEASLLYRRALQKDPKCAEAWFQLGLVNNRLTNLADARKEFARAMDLDPANTAAIVRLGDLDLLFYAADQSRNKELLADLKDLAQTLLRRDKKSYDGLRLAGEIALIEKDLPRAIHNFEEANLVKPHQKDLVLALAQSLETAGQDDRAIDLAREMIQHDQSAAALYDFLYANCLRSHQIDSAEEILKQKISKNPTEGAYWLQLALHYSMTHHPAEMIQVIDRLTAKGSGFTDARLQVGDFYARIHLLDQALTQYALGAQEDPKQQHIYQKKMVEVLAAQGKIADASKLLESVQRDTPKDPDAIGLHAALLLANGKSEDTKKAIGELEPLARKSASPVLHYDLGRAYLASGALDRARAQFAEVLRIDSRHTTARLGLAQTELGQGDNGLALTEASRALIAEPANLTALLVRARALINTGDFARARRDIEIALGIDARSADARFELADLDLKTRRFHEAEAEFQSLAADGDTRGVTGAIEALAAQRKWDQAIQIARTHAFDQSLLADLLLSAGKFAEAAAQFQAIIDRTPRSEKLYLGMGDAKAHLNDTNGAAAAFQKARELAPADPAPDVDLGILYDRARRFLEARAAYESALAKQPDNATALNNLAYLEADQGVDLDQALAYAQRARSQRPDDVNVIDTLGMIYVKKNLTDEGLRMLREVVARQPENATFRLHLAAAWYQKGDRTMARKELNAARRSNPTISERAAIQDLLARVG
jgi:tetratricopeptide (TPR) repeat protein